MSTQAQNAAASGKELAAIHDFGSKLTQPTLMGRLCEYVLWQREIRQAEKDGKATDLLLSKIPGYAPVSINLDLTTACNYRCDHCIDMEILNTGIRYDYDRLLDSLDVMARNGMKSVILIGGGEPTVFPKFTEVVEFLKNRDVHVSVVSNGSGNAKILEVADLFGKYDWVRLSLDSGTDETFQAMHKPRKPVSLDEICEGIPPIKEKNPILRMGFSFIITWKGAQANNTTIVENIHEIVTAAERARKYKFDYISLKPFLVRAPENNAELMGVTDEWKEYEDITRRIREAVKEAKKLETDTFKVVESSNLRVLENRSYRDYTGQPKRCHMQFFRQVLSPLGVFNCPVYRHVKHAQVGDKHGYATEISFKEMNRNTAALIQNFDASKECKDVTCLYNPANWFLEDLIENPERLDALDPSAERLDFFL